MSKATQFTQSRRDFMRMAGIAAGFSVISVAGARAAGASEAADSGDSSTGALGSQITSVDDVSWDEQCDVLIVGAGIAGLSAAVTLTREAPDKKVILVEKGSTGSGCSPVASGDFLFGTADEPYPLQYLKDMATTPTGQTIPDDVLQAFVDGIDENLPWLLSTGLSIDELTLRYPYEERAKAEYREFDSWASPEGTLAKDNEFPRSHLYSYLNSLITDDETYAQVDYRTDCALTSLIVDQATRGVVGGVAGGSKIRATDGVIMCCGGYEHSAEFLEGFCGVGNAMSFALMGNTGDGHIMVAGAGADFWHMHNAAGFWMHPRDLADAQFATGPLSAHKLKKFGITVGANGRRFYMDWDGHKSLDTADDAISEDLSLHVGSRHGVMQFGGEWNHLPMPSTGWFVFDSNNLENAFDADYTSSTDPVADGWLLVSDTIEGLADQMGVPAGQLANTVDQWNEFCEEGEDRAFYRPADTLTPVKTAPFYAQRCRPALLNTDGGPKRSAKGEVLGVDGSPIPGLYAAGEFGSVWGYLYNGNGNIGEAMAFGRIAARNAVGLDQVPADGTYEEVFTPEDKTREAVEAAAAASSIKDAK
ncbi:MAG: FAD-dependent oxidoreductase [Coriobacteriales bacterium]|jgi:succinate dehydrogenase/fumarate reductase flavoprotein subunit